jgi:hypothetical protein
MALKKSMTSRRKREVDGKLNLCGAIDIVEWKNSIEKF